MTQPIIKAEDNGPNIDLSNNQQVYWVHYDPNSLRLDDISAKPKDGFTEVMVDEPHMYAFTSHFSSISYDPQNHALVYPGNYPMNLANTVVDLKRNIIPALQNQVNQNKTDILSNTSQINQNKSAILS